MRITFEDGSAWYVDGDTLPPDMTIAALQALIGAPCIWTAPWPI